MQFMLLNELTLGDLWEEVPFEKKLLIQHIIHGSHKNVGLEKCFACRQKDNHRYENIINITSYYEAVTCSKECEEYLRLLLC